jgi:hypothetical protein
MQVIELAPGTRIWLTVGVTDMRRGFQGLSAQVQTVLPPQRRRPVAGDPGARAATLLRARLHLSRAKRRHRQVSLV